MATECHGDHGKEPSLFEQGFEVAEAVYSIARISKEYAVRFGRMLGFPHTRHLAELRSFQLQRRRRSG